MDSSTTIPIQFKMIFANQSIDTKVRYELIRETKSYYFIREMVKEPFCTFRVHKRTLNTKSIKDGVNGYMFDVPSPITLIKL